MYQGPNALHSVLHYSMMTPLSVRDTVTARVTEHDCPDGHDSTVEAEVQGDLYGPCSLPTSQVLA